MFYNYHNTVVWGQINSDLGPPIIAIIPTGGLLHRVFVRCHTVIIWLVIVLALTAVVTVYSLQDQLHVL